jgi:exoribonuclease R
MKVELHAIVIAIRGMMLCFIVEELMLVANMSAAEVISNTLPTCALLCRLPELNLRKSREFRRLVLEMALNWMVHYLVHFTFHFLE